MAEENQTSQTVNAPTQGSAPVEPDIDSLLGNIPALGGLFGEEPKAAEQPGQPEQATKEGVPETEPGTSETAQAQELPEAKPQEEEKPPEEQPKKEEGETRVQKRIDELTAKRKAAEERVTSLETELADLKARVSAPPPVAPTPDNPLADIESEQDLDTRLQMVVNARAWLTENPDGGPVQDGKGGTKYIEPADARRYAAEYDRILWYHAPRKREYIGKKAQYDAEAKRVYPDLFKEGTEANRVRNFWLSVNPSSREFPDYNLIIGDALRGQADRMAQSKKTGAPNGKLPAAQLPLAAPAPAASPRVPQSKALSGNALQAAWEQNPDAAFTNFVDGLIDSAAAQRARQ